MPETNNIEEQTTGTDTSKSIAVNADIATSFTFASHQNAIPVIRSITVENDSDQLLENCQLELTSSPAFLRAKTWNIDRLFPGDKLPLTDRKVDLDPHYLSGLNEAERGEIRLRLTANQNTLLEEHLPIRLLARDEWGGVADMAELLPAFVMPNDPGIPPVLRAAAERLVAHGHSGGLDGYQSGKPERAYILTAAIYSAVAGLRLHYSEPPASFEMRGQKVRRPSVVCEEKLATCLDSSLLFAAALEAVGLNSVVLLFDGHASVAVWVQKRSFSQIVERDHMEVRKAIANKELIAFETTGATYSPPLTFEQSISVIEHRLRAESSDAFVAAIDIRRARSGGITPLASHHQIRKGPSELEDLPPTELPLPQVPNLGQLPKEQVDEKPTTAAGRIDRWQKKLLDLSLRNRLLNFPDSKKAIPFLCTDVAYLEDRLANGVAIRLTSLSEHNALRERDEDIYREIHGRELQRSLAAEALNRDELPSPLDSKQLEARLTELYRQVRNDLAEGGANTLFLAVGFLHWKENPGDQKVYRAPLLLVPVRLERRSASSRFNMRFHEDEPRFNSTLAQFLERDFDLSLPELTRNLPLDENGVDVPLLLATIRHAVRDVPGMEVVDEAALSTFSFAKFLMWKDLVERTQALRENRVVRHLIDTPEQPFVGNQAEDTFCNECDIDRKYSPADIINLLPADSSQAAACIAAVEGRDFVIIGPPGTGKSQTIANIIANCLAYGKTVLFVAEKTAALDVVHRRLREHGLGNHCIELHSSKTDRRHFLAQLKTAWEQGGRKDQSEWIEVNERLRLRRDELNAYVDALHHVHTNGWSAYYAFGLCLKFSDAVAPHFNWSNVKTHDRESFLALEEAARNLGLVFSAIKWHPSLSLVNIEEWSSVWQDSLLSEATALANSIDELTSSAYAFLSCLGLEQESDIPRSELTALAHLAQVLVAGRSHNLAVAFLPEINQLPGALNELEYSIATYKESQKELTATYEHTSIKDIDAESLERGWREANASLWPKSFLAKRKIRKLLQSYTTSGVSDPEIELPVLRRLKTLLGEIDKNPLARHPSLFSGLSTDIQSVRELLNEAQALRSAMRLPGRTQDELRCVTQTVAEAVEGTEREDLWQAAARILSALQVCEAQSRSFARVSGKDSAVGLSLSGLKELSTALKEVGNIRHLLRDWAAWCSARNKAHSLNLAPLVERIEAGAIAPHEALHAFRLGYARWWLPKVIDENAPLRSFRRFQHEHAIEDFREIDDLVRSHAAQRVISSIAHDLPSVQSVSRNSELGLLRHQMELQRPSQSIRELIGKLPHAFPKLAPCMLMSPLSIAQYLPPDHALFDVVIFDEASQVTTWDAVGAIARARQTIIVGDPKQLPPTNFFGRNEEEEDVAEHEQDLESILDEARAAGIPQRYLTWHYRSRSESLIAFSNHHYYQNKLVTFPSPSVDDRAVQLRKVPHGVYDRGKSRTNRIEADALVKEALDRMTSWLELPEKVRPTLGIITFNIQQQALIQDLLDAARRSDPRLEWFFAEERVEATIVKNLENVQGDERDVILFSVTFWKDAAGKLTMDFGALNREGGERRLNVAVTRARQELIVFSGFTADQIDTSRAKGLGVQHLKTFLDYAERGAIALPAQEQGSVGSFESPFEEAVAAQLESRGWQVVPQVGVSGFRIDLGVRHPDLAGTYLAGIECDGATYHRAHTARDRDKVREQVLRGLGWEIIRVWSTDWWFDAAGCANRLHAELEAVLEKSRRLHAANQSHVETHWDMGHQVEDVEEIRDEEVQSEASTSLANGEPVLAPENAEECLSSVEIDAPLDDLEESKGYAPTYRLANLDRFHPDPTQFFESNYTNTLKQMIDEIVESESPVRVDILAQRISRAHGWLRTGSRIRERIDMHLKQYDRTQESTGEFIWKKGSVAELIPYRWPPNAETRRAVADIPLAELASVVLEHPNLLNGQDPARNLARFLGVDRLASPSRSRLEEAIELARRFA